MNVAAALADPTAVVSLRKADPVMAQLIDARTDFRPRAWMQELPPLDPFGTLICSANNSEFAAAHGLAFLEPSRRKPRI